MKKRSISALICALSVMISAFSCGSSSDVGSSEQSSTAETTTEAAEETTVAPTTAPPATTKQVTTAPPKHLQRSDIFSGNVIYYMITPNSADGLQYIWADKYTGTKTVNYYTCNYKMENSVGDPAYDDIRGSSTFSVKTVGPVNNGDYMIDISGDDPSAYCGVCSTLYLESIELEYSDGTTDTVDYNWYVPEQNATWTNVWVAIQNNTPDFYNYVSNL